MFPLTTTLSLGEREQPLDGLVKFERNQAEASRGLDKTLGAILPLRWGEGRGEGKENIHLQTFFGMGLLPASI